MPHPNPSLRFASLIPDIKFGEWWVRRQEKKSAHPGSNINVHYDKDEELAVFNNTIGEVG